MSHHYKLYYFNSMGRAEPTRLIFAYKGVKYEDIRIEHEKFSEYESKFPFGQMPVLEVDGKMLGQSQAINRYLGRTLGMAGSNDWEGAQCDMLADGVTDVINNLMPWFMEHDEEKKKTIWTTFENEHAKPFLALYEKFLKQSGTGHFVGKSMTWADIVIFSILTWWNQANPHLVEPHADLIKFMGMVASEPKIKHWIETRPKTNM